MIKAIFFDLDGVLADMCDNHYQSLNRALKEVCGYEISYDEHVVFYNGISTNAKLKILENRGLIDEKDWKRIWELKQKYTFEYIDNLKPDKVKIELCHNLMLGGYVLACVSNSIRESIEKMLTRLDIREYFRYIFANEDFGEKHKPDPYPYLLAMEKTGFTKDEVLIVEDSPKGILSGQRSGARVWEVRDQNDVSLVGVTNKLFELEPWLMNTCFEDI